MARQAKTSYLTVNGIKGGRVSFLRMSSSQSEQQLSSTRRQARNSLPKSQNPLSASLYYFRFQSSNELETCISSCPSPVSSPSRLFFTPHPPLANLASTAAVRSIATSIKAPGNCPSRNSSPVPSMTQGKTPRRSTTAATTSPAPTFHITQTPSACSRKAVTSHWRRYGPWPTP